MSSHPLWVNRTTASVDAWDPDMPLLYVLRNGLVLHGTKFGCGLGQCVACTVLLELANAVFHATGVRLRTVPFTRERVKAAVG